MIREGLLTSGKSIFNWMYAKYMQVKNYVSDRFWRFIRWVTGNAPQVASQVVAKPKSFHEQWMIHFNNTIKSMNKRKF